MAEREQVVALLAEHRLVGLDAWSCRCQCGLQGPDADYYEHLADVLSASDAGKAIGAPQTDGLTDVGRPDVLATRAEDDDAREPFLVEPGWVRADFVADGSVDFFRLLTYADETVRFEHRCDRGERGVVICAPALQSGHAVTYSLKGRPTVRPSILCPDCGTHGFVTDGRWSA